MLSRLWNGPYTLCAYLTVVSLGAAAISGAALGAEGYLLYHGFPTISGTTHLSESFFSGLLVTLITGVILHRHATKAGQCATLPVHGRCPFLGIFLLGLTLGAAATAIIYFIQGSQEIAFGPMLQAKIGEGIFLGLVIPFFFFQLKLLIHPSIRHE